MQAKHQADYLYNQTERDTMEFQEQTIAADKWATVK